MKKKFIVITIFSVLAILTCFIIWNFKAKKPASSPVSENGKLKIENTNIINKNGEIFNLKGISSSGIQWTYEMLTYENLKTLKENNITATFFITAHYLNTASELVQRMIDDGHIIGNHTVNHKSMPSLTKEELSKELTEKICNIRDKCIGTN